jgi:kynurenine formamidase
VIDGFPDALETVDLTHAVSAGMPCYPGTEPPVFVASCTLANHGFEEKTITMYSHTGTHVDAPAHILEGARTLDGFDAGAFVGSGVVLDLARPCRTVIGREHLEPWGAEIEDRDFVLLRTGKSEAWGQPDYFDRYPVLSEGAARWLAGFRPKGVGVDAVSVDPVDTESYPGHRLLLERGILVIENLARLETLLGRTFLLCCLPLKIERADGAPVRAVALVPRREAGST